jgi:hypothetical protein
MWLETADPAWFMNDWRWAWRIFESIHFVGLCFLIGTVGLFDLRMLGMAKPVSMVALHKLVPWGIAGYAMNVMTGISFFAAAPDQYMYNPAFQYKILFMGMAGINVLTFYLAMYRKVAVLGPGDDAPMAAKIMAGVSLSLWLGVIICGRLLTFFRPPFFQCPWC